MVQDGYFSCEEFLHRLPGFLDREHHPADEALLRDHLVWCERCLRKYRFERALIDVVRQRLSSVEVPAGLQDRVAAVLSLATPVLPGELL